MGRRKFALSLKKRYSRAPKPSSQDWPALHTTLRSTDLGRWSYISTPPADTIRLCKFNSAGPMTTTMTFDIVRPTMKWSLQVYGKPVKRHFQDLPLTINSASDVSAILQSLEAFHTCRGIDDSKYSPLTELRRNFFSKTGEKVAYYDQVNKTIRHVECALLLDGSSPPCCSQCKHYRFNSLNKLLYRHKKNQSSKVGHSSHVNYRYLDKESSVKRMRNMQKELKRRKDALNRKTMKLSNIIEKESMPVDKELHSDLVSIMNNRLPETEKPDDFKSLFWKQQLQSFSCKNARSMKWHPIMIKFCLYLYHKSSSAYELLRKSGVVRLPSGRTLRDYRQFSPEVSGFSNINDKQLRDMAHPRQNSKYINLLIDEMHVKEGLVYSKATGAIVGFYDMGDLNNEFSEYEKLVNNSSSSTKPASRTPAKTILTFMVRGLVTDLAFPYAIFPSMSPKGCDIFPLLWEAIERLTRSGFRIMAVTGDGASCNRRLFQMHATGREKIYKIKNVFSADKHLIYFFVDPPHLIKTIRNCLASNRRSLWSDSRYDAQAHHVTVIIRLYCLLQCQGQELGWSHIINLYRRNMGAATGLCLVPKIKYEHIYLNSFSKMRVDLAAQVLSTSVSEALYLTGGKEAFETAYFISKIDKFFDCLNVRHYLQGKHARKSFLQPYRSKKDFRFDFLKNEFLPYLAAWKKSVSEREGFSKEEKGRMMLSQQTLTGIEVTVNSFLEFVPELLGLPGVSYFLSDKLNQDPLENFFGLIRQHGRVNNNPTIYEAMKSTQTLRVIKSVAIDDICGNCRGRKRAISFSDLDDSPLPKKKRSCPYI